MNKTALVLIHAAIASLGLSGCGRKEGTTEGAAATAEQAKPESIGPGDSAAMSNDMPMEKQASTAEHSATGMVTAVDVAASTVTIAHEAVASAKWPAMTMTFKLADSSKAAGLKVNEHVQFSFVLNETGDATVVAIAPAAHQM